MNEMPEPEWMRKLFDREEEPRVIGESITVIMALYKVVVVAKAAELLLDAMASDGIRSWLGMAKGDLYAEVHSGLKEAIHELPEGTIDFD